MRVLTTAPGSGCWGRYRKSARAPSALPPPARWHLERPVKRREVRGAPAHALYFVEDRDLRVDAHRLGPAPEAPAQRHPRVGLDQSPGVGSSPGHPPSPVNERAAFGRLPVQGSDAVEGRLLSATGLVPSDAPVRTVSIVADASRSPWLTRDGGC